MYVFLLGTPEIANLVTNKEVLILTLTLLIVSLLVSKQSLLTVKATEEICYQLLTSTSLVQH